jgi:hypothetical protein
MRVFLIFVKWLNYFFTCFLHGCFSSCFEPPPSPITTLKIYRIKSANLCAGAKFLLTRGPMGQFLATIPNTNDVTCMEFDWLRNDPTKLFFPRLADHCSVN